MVGRAGSDQAESLAIEALAFVAGDDVLRERFLSLSGIEAAQIRQAAAEPGFLAGVLRFILAHEPTLLAYCAASGHRPEAVARALRALPGGDDSQEYSA